MLKACLESLTSPRQTIKNSGVFSTDELTISDMFVKIVQIVYLYFFLILCLFFYFLLSFRKKGFSTVLLSTSFDGEASCGLF